MERARLNPLSSLVPAVSSRRRNSIGSALAAAAKADPIEFRLRLLTAGTREDSGFKRARSIAVVRAAAKAYGWETRPSPKRLDTAPVLTGRGIAYAFRNQTVVAEIAEVEVNRRTGHVWVKRLVCAHDC